jgi:hypothetical protein
MYNKNLTDSERNDALAYFNAKWNFNNNVFNVSIPQLTYDNAATLTITGAETDAIVEWYSADIQIAQATGLTLSLTTGGTYRASIAGPTVFTVSTNSIFVDRLFSDGWFAVDGSTSVALGSSFTLPVYSPSDGVTVTGTVDVNTAGSYTVTYSVEGKASVVRSFVVEMPMIEYPIAFHYGNFDSKYGDASVEAAALQGRVFANTLSTTYEWGTLVVVSTSDSITTYNWTPKSEMSADVLMVAGGGGAGGILGGGGGAGGLVFRENESLSGTKTITVGNGNIGGVGYANGQAENGFSGTNTTFTSLPTSIGGGAGSGHKQGNGRSGGSGGGGGSASVGGSGTSGQGNTGGRSSNDGGEPGYGGGGGGAGGAGGSANGSAGGNGGIGRNMTPYFTNIYGDSGWFASGGGGGIRSGRNATLGIAFIGGGVSGNDTTSKPPDAKRHTGGGGGGAGFNGGSGSRLGGTGGSGIVLIKQVPPPPQYRYLAFYGEVSNNGSATFHEIELTLGTPLNGSSEIKYGVNDTGITFYESKAWNHNSGLNDHLTIMNGYKGWENDPNKVMYEQVVDVNAIFWYMDLGTGVVADVNGGTFWTLTAEHYAFTNGKLYGTNTDPADFADASLIANYEFVCDLTKITAS